MKKFTVLFLVFSTFLLSGLMFAQVRKGADLIIQKKNGQQVRGELIAVRQTSLLLKEYEKGIDVIVDTGDVRVINILKKSQALLGGTIGLLLGGVVGFAIGSPQGTESGFILSKAQTGGIGAAIGGVLCALIGAGIGANLGTDKTISIEGKSEPEIKEVLEELRKKASVKNSQ
jgi:hypothetical protein